MARPRRFAPRRKPKLLSFGKKPKRSSWLFGWSDQAGHKASSRKYDLMRFPQY